MYLLYPSVSLLHRDWIHNQQVVPLIQVPYNEDLFLGDSKIVLRDS